jgi:hypothetical protein
MDRHNLKNLLRCYPPCIVAAFFMLHLYMCSIKNSINGGSQLTLPSLAISSHHHLLPCQPASISLQHHLQLSKTQIIMDSVEVADQIKLEQESSHTQVPTVVLFLSDSKYQLRFEEMINTWSHFAGGKDRLVMAALDEATEAYFQSRGVKTVRVFPELLDAERSVREAVLRAKVEVSYVFLLKGLRVVMVEMDIYCRSNPLGLDTGTAELLVTEHDYCEEVNVGFWIAYPTCPILDSFRRMQAWVGSQNRTHAYCDGAFDQKLMHFAWLGDGALSAGSGSACRNFEQRDQVFDPNIDKAVALERISFRHIMHWAPPWVQPPDLDSWPNNSADPLCVHIWSGFGPPLSQIRYGYRRNWFPSVSKEEAEIALGQISVER